VAELPVELQPESFATNVFTVAVLLLEIGSSMFDLTLTESGSAVRLSSLGSLSMMYVLVTFLVSPGFIVPKAQGKSEAQSPELDWKMMTPLGLTVVLKEAPGAGQGPLFVTTAW
jgi:hypothetical protein